MRLIDADALEKSLENSCATDFEAHCFVSFLSYVDEQPTVSENELRKEIARKVEEKMCYLNTCLNERDMILKIILDDDKIDKSPHCNTDCLNTKCKSYHFGKK